LLTGNIAQDLGTAGGGGGVIGIVFGWSCSCSRF
jgi:hypothetical protein